jgi:hypothetical protein
MDMFANHGERGSVFERAVGGSAMAGSTLVTSTADSARAPRAPGDLAGDTGAAHPACRPAAASPPVSTAR